MNLAGSAREILECLVAFPTESRVSNLDLIDWVEAYLTDLGVASVRVPAADGQKKASLYAHVGPMAPDGVILSGHSDVVPVAGQDWSSDPFELTERDGRLYGRGTADMKGFVALALAAVPFALKAPLKRPLQLAISYDEEVGCLAAPALIDAMVASDLPRAGAVIVGEPSMMQVVTGHKGSIINEVEVRGYEVHSSQIDRGVNAIMSGAQLIDWANQMNARGAATAPGPLDADFEPPWSTLHVGTIRGGTAHNITARECHFDFDIRTVPGDSGAGWATALADRVAEIEAGMQAVRAETWIKLTPVCDIPGLAPETDGRAEALARRLTGDNATHVVSYATEAGQFQAAGYSAVVCGPGDIAQAHQADEFIALSQLEAGATFMTRLIDDLCR